MAKSAKIKHYRPPGKKQEGNVAKYTTRNKALNRLQLKLPEFRRLCILKGIHPREPKKKFEGHDKTYYHVKDINFLAHEPLLEKCREIKAFEKKIKKARAKKNSSLAVRLEKNKPSYSLDHLVKERYPSFIDALRDLDDPLTLVHLFATFPAEVSYKIAVETINNCRRLSLEWQAFVAQTHSLRKTFISVKGIYYQAEVAGQKITWLTPHILSQIIPDDVDIRVMLTFVEFYETLLGFVNFKLYHSLGLKYPPILDPQLEAEAAELYAVMRDLGRDSEICSTATANSNSDQSNNSETWKTEAGLAESQARLALLQDRLLMMVKDNGNSAMNKELSAIVEQEEKGDEDDDEETRQCKNLFKSLKFFLGREVPRESLLFVIRAFGGVATWEGNGAPFNENDEDITHQVVDRPSQGHIFLSREYVQPQWVYDCVNNRILLPTSDYLLGRVPPPHLSPFVDNDKEGYLPEYAESIKRLQAASQAKILPLPGEEIPSHEDVDGFVAQVAADRKESNNELLHKTKESILEKVYVEELEKEIEGISYSALLQAGERSNFEQENIVDGNDGDDNTSLSMAHVMMPRKARKLYEAMQLGNAKKRAGIELLKERKKKQMKESNSLRLSKSQNH